MRFEDPAGPFFEVTPLGIDTEHWVRARVRWGRAPGELLEFTSDAFTEDEAGALVLWLEARAAGRKIHPRLPDDHPTREFVRVPVIELPTIELMDDHFQLFFVQGVHDRSRILVEIHVEYPEGWDPNTDCLEFPVTLGDLWSAARALREQLKNIGASIPQEESQSWAHYDPDFYRRW